MPAAATDVLDAAPRLTARASDVLLLDAYASIVERRTISHRCVAAEGARSPAADCLQFVSPDLPPCQRTSDCLTSVSEA